MSNADRKPEVEAGTVESEFTAFVRENVSWLWSFLRAYGASPAEVEDVIQATLVEAYRQWATIESPRAWVATVARRRMWRELTQRSLPLEALVEEDLPPMDQTLTRADVLDVRGAIRQLPDKQRNIVFLKYFEGLETEQIAKRMGMKTSTVRTHISRALARLATLLQDQSDKADRRACARGTRQVDP